LFFYLSNIKSGSHRYLMKKYYTSSLIIIIIILVISACNNNKPTIAGNTNTTNTFGDSIPSSSGLVGEVFLLPDTTTMLPDFDTMKALDSKIYAQEINVPSQSWSQDFPGLRNRFEWFGIEYNCTFTTNKPGNYVFRLLSDDGSKLFIDDTLLINNDGRHAQESKSGNIYLNSSVHSAKIQYFQGPRYQLALQLFWSMKDSTEQIFPGKNFVLTAIQHSHFPWWMVIVASFILIAVVIFIWGKRNSQKVTRPGN